MKQRSKKQPIQSAREDASCWVSMSKEMWKNFLSDSQKKNGVSHEERKAIYEAVKQEFCLRYPVSNVVFE
jgi:hypothetical protein